MDPLHFHSGVSVRFAKCALFLLQLASNLCKIARKMRIICTLKKSDVLCFQPLLSFVPSIFHFCNSPLPPVAATIPPSLGCRGDPARACDNVSTPHSTIVGYHRSLGLSSKKCQKSVGAITNLFALCGQDRPSPKCRLRGTSRVAHTSRRLASSCMRSFRTRGVQTCQRTARLRHPRPPVVFSGGWV